MFTRKCGTATVKNKIKAVDIGLPTNMIRGLHVAKNPETGLLEGLPKDWSKLWDKRCSSSQQNGDPEEAKKTAKFYTAENHKAPEEPSRCSAEVKKEEEE